MWPLLILMPCLSHRVSIPLSILDPPHRYRIHRRKSFDASDTLALPRVSCLPKGIESGICGRDPELALKRTCSEALC